MGPPVPNDPQEWELIRRAGSGESRCLDELFARYRNRLKRMVKLSSCKGDWASSGGV